MTQMRAAISDPDTIAALTPPYEPGCQRILVSDDYYPALAKSHVRLVPHGVVRMREGAVVAADESQHAVDVVIFCTGYKLGGRTDGRPAVEVFGPQGERLREALARAPEAYRGVAIPGFPNYFTICGLNGAPGHAPVFLTAEVAADYVARWLRRLVNDDLITIETKRDATRRYNDAIQAELQQMSWAVQVGTGRVLPFHPGAWGRMRRELL